MKKQVISIGMFDGVHSGHQKVLKAAVNYSKKNKAESIVLTFDHIPQKHRGNLTALNEKIELIKSAGIGKVNVISFETIKNFSADKFCTMYLKNCFGIIVGHDFRFGKNRKGSVKDIKHFCKNVLVINPIKSNGDIISSTNIKKLLLSGRIEAVNKLLDRKYSFSGRVIKGLGLGRKLGFSTANISVASDKILPPGIFTAVVQFGGRKKYQAVVYIGKRPTFGGKIISVEVYILNFSKKIYGRKIKVELISKIRGDEKFPSAEKLIEKIKNDLKISKSFFKRHKNNY